MKTREKVDELDAVMMVVLDEQGKEKTYKVDEVTCNECGKGDEEDLILLCDGCPDGASHTYCCDPPRDGLPDEDEDWFCTECIRLARPKMLVPGQEPKEEEEEGVSCGDEDEGPAKKKRSTIPPVIWN